jgi:two-component system chemotaxis response regulator CheB
MNRERTGTYRAVVVGVSMGGVEALRVLFAGLPRDFALPVLVVEHISPDSDNDPANLFNEPSALRVKEADEGELAVSGTAYLAPANYHLLIERNGRLALSTDPAINFARPSVDVLFESAAEAFGPALIGVILTGAGSDGSAGLKCIKDKGGLAVVQDPTDADADSMPRCALTLVKADHVLPLREIAPLLCRLAEAGRNTSEEKGQGADDVVNLENPLTHPAFK